MHFETLYNWCDRELQGFVQLGDLWMTIIAVAVLMIGLAQCVFGLRLRFIWATAISAFSLRIVGGLVASLFFAGQTGVILGIGLGACAAGIALSVFRPRVGAVIMCIAGGFGLGYLIVGLPGGIVLGVAGLIGGIARPRPFTIGVTSLMGGTMAGFAVTSLMGMDYKICAMMLIFFTAVGLVVQTLLFYSQLQKDIFEYEDEVVEEVSSTFSASLAGTNMSFEMDFSNSEGPAKPAVEKSEFIFEEAAPAPVQAPTVNAAPATQPVFTQAAVQPLQQQAFSPSAIPQPVAVANNGMAASQQHPEYAMAPNAAMQQPQQMYAYNVGMMPQQPQMIPQMDPYVPFQPVQQMPVAFAGQACNMCGQQLPMGAMYCGSCGTTVETQVFCPFCGQPASMHGFCGNCGYSLG